MSRTGSLLAAFLLCALPSRAQSLDDGGSADAATADCTPTGPTADGGCGIQPATFTSNVGCSTGSGTVATLLSLLAVAVFARRRRACLAVVALLSGASVSARAQESAYPPFSEEKPARQRIAITSSPIAAFIGRRLGVSASVMIVSHHALELTLFHIDQKTGTDSNNEFRGWGQELGYRYYSGEDGPRGFFIGPSLLLGRYTAIPLVGGDQIRYSVPGVAVDLGYQALLIDRLVVGLGAGLQYTVPGVSLPPQEIPVSNYANKGVRPRVLFALGFSFLSI
jgi:hypothetical protein